LAGGATSGSEQAGPRLGNSPANGPGHYGPSSRALLPVAAVRVTHHVPVPTVGVLLPTFDAYRDGRPRPIASFARRAEELGFDGVWAGDHLICPAPILDAMTAVTTAAAVTQRVTVGFSVMLLGLRPLVWTAKQLITLQQLSGGRVQLGVGVGGEFPQEYEAAGVPTTRRGRRLDEALAALPGLITGAEDAGAKLEPSAPMPRLLVGGRSDAAMRRAIRSGDAWLPMWISPATLASRNEELGELAVEAGREAPAQGLLMLTCVGASRDWCLREADGHLRGQYRMPVDRVEHWTGLGEPARIAELIDEYVASGVREVILMPLGRDQLAQLEGLGDVLGLISARMRPRSELEGAPAGAPEARQA
jgi:alkanesulfonate monooxygenase SsuD/methylene tetrahydromethanopterin reductase-like flavin-dependent oxidoreductase (luciferase family)